jgi:hypothetical protein
MQWRKLFILLLPVVVSVLSLNGLYHGMALGVGTRAVTAHAGFIIDPESTQTVTPLCKDFD